MSQDEENKSLELEQVLAASLAYTQKEYKRAKAVYDIDLNDKETEDEFKNLYNEATKISKNILDEKRKKENIKQEKEEKPSLFETIKKTLGFNKGGVVNINYLTREL